MSHHILVVEDDPSLLLGLKMNLSKAGYQVTTADDGQVALAELARQRPDLVILDLMLPGVNGLQVLRRIRENDNALPVIVLTALGAEQDKIRGLDLGANDYVTKPFSIAELLARVRATLRSAKLGSDELDSELLRSGNIELHRGQRKVTVKGAPIELTSREFDVLQFLMERPERVLTREQILTNLWGTDYEGTDRTVDNFVSALRKKLGEDPDQPRHLKTVWGIGYRFVP